MYRRDGKNSRSSSTRWSRKIPRHSVVTESGRTVILSHDYFMRALDRRTGPALLIGVLLAGQGILGISAPDVFVGFLRFVQTPPVTYVAAAVRVLFGVVLIRAAAGSRAARFLRVFGFIIVIGGLLTPFVGVRFAELIFDWWSAGGPALVRVFGGVSLALGLFVIYAIAPDRRRSSSIL
jgi:hypothetical protein